ncbi:MAG: hypothetical protein RML35_09830 [Chloroherpetonaceae bacterium]|nr:hypothetical protein [Chloroherpetonaceae bacterium]
MTDVTGSNLGIVNGTGIIKVNVAGVPTATFTTNFLNNGGTIEYSGASYILPATPTTYGSLAVTGSNATRNLGANTNIINELSVGGAIAGVVITAGGSGYSVNDVVTFTGGNGRGAFGYVSAVGAWGAVTGITITNPGFGYTSPPTINIASSSGTGFSGVAIPSRRHDAEYERIYGKSLYAWRRNATWSKRHLDHRQRR